MKSSVLILLVVCVVPATIHTHPSFGDTPTFNSSDWPWWRGPNRDGVAVPGQQPPTTWSDRQNIRWRTPIPGTGHASATVLGRQVYLPIADDDRQIQAVRCFDRKTGIQRWETVIHEGGFDNQGRPNKKTSLASSTIATDGKRLFVSFLNDSAVSTTAIDLDGSIIWTQKISDYVIHQGYGSSPAIWEDLVIVAADNKSGGAIVGLKRDTGTIAWTHERPRKPNYPSPIIFSINGRDQLFMTGCDLVTCLDPRTGNVQWEVPGATTECVTTTVTDGKQIFTSGGYPKNHISAVVVDDDHPAGASGTVVWETNTRAYVPSLLYRDGYLYATLDAGVAICVRCRDGHQMWKGRLGGTFSGSPVLVGDVIYAANESGETFLFRAEPSQFELLGKNRLGDSVFATPTICGGEIFMRVAIDENGKRQEYLICIAQ